MLSSAQIAAAVKPGSRPSVLRKGASSASPKRVSRAMPVPTAYAVVPARVR
jgi:hypothetical protein